MLGHKTSLTRFKKIEIISTIFSEHMTMTYKSTVRKNSKTHKHMEAKHMRLNNQWVTEEKQEEIKKIPGDKRKQTTMIQSL